MNDAMIKLSNVARRQAGLFTRVQAANCGVAVQNAAYYIDTGSWKKIPNSSGLYQMTAVEADNEDQYALWLAYLWATKKDGSPGAAVAGKSALYLRGLSDVVPSQVCLAVEKGFRRRSEPPATIEFCRMELCDEDVDELDTGMQVLSPVAALRELMRADETSLEHIRQGFIDALDRGQISLADVAAPKGYTERERDVVQSWFPKHFKKIGSGHGGR